MRASRERVSKNITADACGIGRERLLLIVTPPKARANQFSASLSALPALNAGTLDALILMFSPVRGLRPVRAERLRTTNVPKPTSDTSSPFFSAFLMISVVASSARPASALERLALSEMALINSALFMETPSLDGERPAKCSVGSTEHILLHRRRAPIGMRCAPRDARFCFARFAAGPLYQCPQSRAIKAGCGFQRFTGLRIKTGLR